MRQALDEGGWFDTEKSTQYKEDRFHDGNNFISKATGGQWEHEALYKSAKGAWILNHWSQWQGSHETWTLIGDEAAAQWLIQNGHEVSEEQAAKLEV